MARHRCAGAATSYVRAGELEKAFKVLAEMEGARVPMSCVPFTILMSACVDAGMPQRAIDTYEWWARWAPGEGGATGPWGCSFSHMRTMHCAADVPACAAATALDAHPITRSHTLARTHAHTHAHECAAWQGDAASVQVHRCDARMREVGRGGAGAELLCGGAHRHSPAGLLSRAAMGARGSCDVMKLACVRACASTGGAERAGFNNCDVQHDHTRRGEVVSSVQGRVRSVRADALAWRRARRPHV